MDRAQENSVIVCEEAVDHVIDCDEYDCPEETFNESSENAHDCHGDIEICSFQDEVIPAIKAFCDNKRFSHALKEAENYVTTKCPQLIILYCSLSLKLNQTKEVVTFIERLTTDKCIEIINKFIDKNFSSFGIQKYIPKIIKLLLNRAVVQLLLTADVHTNKLTKYLKLWIERNIIFEDFEKMVKKLLELRIPNHNVFVLFDTLKDFNRGSNNYLMLKWEIFIRAITCNLNEYEYLKFSLECNENHLFEEEKNISNRYLQLAELCSYNMPVQSECLLTAYSLNPTIETYNLIKENSVKINRLKPPKQPKPIENACCKNLYFNTLCDKCGDIKSKESALQLNDSNRNVLSNECTDEIFSGKVFFYDGNVTNNDESLQQMATDLITVLTCPRNKLITWELEWETLNQNLLCLLKPNNKINLVKQYTANANSKLQFLKLDYNDYRHLPEPELPGIEKGYEAYLDTDYETDDDNNTVATPKVANNNGVVKPGKSEVAAGGSEHRKIDGKKKESRKKTSLEASIIKLIKSLESPKKMTIASPSYNQPNVPCLDRLNSNGEIQSSLYIVPEPSMIDGNFLSLSNIEETQGASSRQSQSNIPSPSNESFPLPNNNHSVCDLSTADTSYGDKMEPYWITEPTENGTNEFNTTTETETSNSFDINCSQLVPYQQITETTEYEANEFDTTTETETSNSFNINCSQFGPYHTYTHRDHTTHTITETTENETNQFNTTTQTTSNSVDINCSQLGPYHHQITETIEIETTEINRTQTETSNSIDINCIETTQIHRSAETFICSASSSMELAIISHVEATETLEFVDRVDLLCAEQIETEEAPQGNFEPNNPQNKQQNFLTSDAILVHSQVEAHTNENSIPSEDETYKGCDQQIGGKIDPEPIKPTDTIPSTGSIIKSFSILSDCVQSIEDGGDRLPDIPTDKETDIPTSNSTKIETSSTSQTVNSEPVPSVNIDNRNKVQLDCSIDECLSPNCDSNNKSYVNSNIECNEEQLYVTTPEPDPVNCNITMVPINDSYNSVSNENSDCEQMVDDQCNSVSDCNSDCDQISNDSFNSVLDTNSDCEQIKSVTNVNTANIECSINLETSVTEELQSDASEKHVLNLEASCIPINNTTAITEQVIKPESETDVENVCNNITSSYHEENLYIDTLENVVNNITSEEIIAWSPVAAADPEEITEVIKFDAPYYFDSDFCIELEEYGEDVSATCVTSIDDLIPEPELEISTPDEGNNNFDANGIYIEKSPEALNGRLDLINIVHSEQTTGFHEDSEQEPEDQFDNLTYPEGMAKLKELKIVVKPFIRECHIPLKRLKLDSDDGSQTFRVTEVSNGQYYGFESVIVLNDTSVQKRLLPTINLKPFSHSNSNQINSKCQLINLKRRKSSANNIICNKRPRILDPDLHNSTLECDIDSNKISDEIPFRWSKQSIKNYGRPKNKNFYKEGSYLKKYEKRCITPSSLLINSNLYNSTLNKAALKLNGGGCIAITSKAFNAQKAHNKSDKNQTVFNNVPGLKTYEHLKISESVRNQAVNIIEVFSGNKSNCVNNSTISGGNSSSTSVVNSISNQTVEVVTSPSTSGSVFHHFVQFNNTSKVNGNQSISGFVPGETSVPQTTPSAIKSSQNIVQFLCKTDGKKIQLTPITNQRISHIQINRVSNENETNGQERENQTTDTILPKFNQAFNNRTATLVSHDPSGIPAVARNLPVLSKLQITPSRPVRISMPVIQKSHSATYSTTTASMVSRSIIQLPLRQLNQMGSNLGVSTIPRQVLITTAPTRLNSLTSVLTNTTEDTTEVVAKPSTTNSNNNKSLDTSTLEQLREFDMVLEQVKERSISSCSNTKEETVVTPKTAPIMASTSVIQKVNLRNVAFIQQKRGSTDAPPVVVLCGSKAKNQTIKPITVSTSSPQVPQVNEERSPTPSESQAATLVQKPPQKLQEDEQTIQRIYDILAEYAEQLRNSPDLKNKPAPRRRSNPTINTVCSTSSQVSNDNDSSSNSSITTSAAPATQIKQTINCSETEANNNSATVLLISSAAINKKHMTEDRSATVKKTTNTTMSATNTQPTLTNKLYSNNCIPINMMKRQQITILSGSKILTTLPTHQKSNMRNDPIILKTIQPTNSIKSINNSTRSFPNTSSPIFVLSSSRNVNTKQLNNEVTINSIVKNTTHTATSTTHFATTTAHGGLNNNNNNTKIVKESSILEKEIKLQKSLSEECEDLGVDEPSASDLFPEADLLLDANTNSPITSSLDDEHYNSSSIYNNNNNNKIDNETDLPTMNFNYNNSNNGSSMIIKQNNNKKRVYGSANWLRGSGCSTRKIVKLSSSAVSPALESTTAAASMEAHNISISLASKNSCKRR